LSGTQQDREEKNMVMRVQMSREGNVCILSIAGEEDTRSDEAVTRVFRECFEGGCYNIVLDMTKLKYLGSRLRKVLLANTKEALAGGGKIKLLNPQPVVRNDLKNNRLLDFFEVYNIRQAAVESFSQGGTRQGPVVPVMEPVVYSDDSGAPADHPQGQEERLDRLENSLVQLVSILRRRGVLGDEDEDRIFG